MPFCTVLLINVSLTNIRLEHKIYDIFGLLVIPSKSCVKDTAKFITLCLKHDVSVLNQTPAAFYQFAKLAETKATYLTKLRYIIFGGDKLNSSQLKTWWNYQAKIGLTTKLINMYGITETNIHSTYGELDQNALTEPNIGKPLSNTKAYVLDQNCNPVPIKVIGELYIAGAGLARGYLNNPKLTAQRFVNNPFASDSDIANGYTKMYKTGDLVRWLPDGNLEYIGRNDFQVKIRGFRIELGEIEEQLLKIPGIKQACVIATTKQKSNQQYLDLADKAQASLTKEDILNKLSLVLPDYMIPASLMKLESLPLTINGKLNKSALPKPEFIDNNSYVAPISELEQTLCNIYLIIRHLV